MGETVSLSSSENCFLHILNFPAYGGIIPVFHLQNIFFSSSPKAILLISIFYNISFPECARTAHGLSSVNSGRFIAYNVPAVTDVWAGI